jgi:hypothetical protein
MTVGQLWLCPAQVGNDLPLHGQLLPSSRDGDLRVVLRGNGDDCDVACGRWYLLTS